MTRRRRRTAAPRKRSGMLPGEAKRQSLVTVERIAKVGETGLTAPNHFIVTSHRLDGVWSHAVELAGQRMVLPGKVVDQINRHRESIIKEQRHMRAVETAMRLTSQAPEEERQPADLP